MKLNQLKVSGKHPKWCGPSALSIITGRTVNYCAKLCAARKNRRGWRRGKGTSKQVKGVNDYDMKFALNKMGFDMTRVEIPMRCHPHQVMSYNPEPFVMPTLHRYMRERGGEQWKGLMLVNVTQHYVVVHKDTVSDNHQEDKHYTEHRWRRKKIEQAWLISRRR